MNDTHKLIVAFFLGLAVALGCAYVFMHNSQPRSAMVAATSVPAAGVPAVEAPAANSPAAQPTEIAKPVAPPQPAPVEHSRVTKEKKRPARTEKKAEAPAAEPTELATTQPTGEALKTDTPSDAIASSKLNAAIPARQPVPAPKQSAPPAPHVVTLNAGTSLNVRLNETLSTDHSSMGDNFSATLNAPLIVDGFIIADKGSRVQGQVVEADRAGRVKGRANMSLELTEISTTDGQRIHIQTNHLLREAAASKKSDAAKIGAGAAIGALIGGLAGGGKGAAIGAGSGGAAGTGLVLGTRGKEVTFPSETPLTFTLSGPVTITEQLRN